MRWIALLLLAFNVLAEDCSSLNLLTEKNSPFERIPVYDQDGNGICYAYAASQMLNYAILRKGAPYMQVHPAWVALQDADRSGRSTLHSGFLDESLKKTISSGSCDYMTVARGVKKWMDRYGYSEAQVLALIDGLTETWSKLGQEKYSREKFKTLLNESATAKTCCSQPDWDNILPNIENFQKVSSPQILRSLIFPDCEGKKTELGSLKVIKFTSTAKSFVDDIGSALSETKNPVGITYCSSSLRDHSYKGLSANRLHFNKGCSPHASIIVGKKKFNNSCHFLLRNTWGTQWTATTAKLNCVCRNIKDRSIVENCTSQTHPNDKFILDSCWIPAKVLRDNTTLAERISQE